MKLRAGALWLTHNNQNGHNVRRAFVVASTAPAIEKVRVTLSKTVGNSVSRKDTAESWQVLLSYTKLCQRVVNKSLFLVPVAQYKYYFLVLYVFFVFICCFYLQFECFQLSHICIHCRKLEKKYFVKKKLWTTICRRLIQKISIDRMKSFNLSHQFKTIAGTTKNYKQYLETKHAEWLQDFELALINVLAGKYLL